MCRNAIFFQQRFLSTKFSPGIDKTLDKLHTLVKWNCSGSSVLKLTFNPTLKKSGNGFRSYARKRLLLLNGLIAIPICFR